MEEKESELEELRDLVIDSTVNMTETMTRLRKIAVENGMEFSPDDEKEFNELLKEANDIIDTIDSAEES